MKTRIITLLLGLMAAISLLTVTVWATDVTPSDPSDTTPISNQQPAAPTPEQVHSLLNDTDLKIYTADNSAKRDYKLRDGWYDSNPSDNDVFWDEDEEVWYCRISLNLSAIMAQFNQDTGGRYAAPSDSFIWLEYNEKWMYGSGQGIYAFVHAFPMPALEDLQGITVSVSCKDGSHVTKAFSLTSFDQVSGSIVRNETHHRYEYHLTLTNSAAKDFVAQYDVAVEKTHSLEDFSGQVVLLWNSGRPDIMSLDDGIAVYADPEPEIPPLDDDDKWSVDKSNCTFNITAVCVNETPRDTSHTRRYPAVTAPVQAAKPTVSSAKTFDGGVALYVGLSLLSVTGSAALLHKRKNV